MDTSLRYPVPSDFSIVHTFSNVQICAVNTRDDVKSEVENRRGGAFRVEFNFRSSEKKKKKKEEGGNGEYKERYDEPVVAANRITGSRSR